MWGQAETHDDLSSGPSGLEGVRERWPTEVEFIATPKYMLHARTSGMLMGISPRQVSDIITRPGELEA